MKNHWLVSSQQKINDLVPSNKKASAHFLPFFAHPSPLFLPMVFLPYEENRFMVMVIWRSRDGLLMEHAADSWDWVWPPRSRHQEAASSITWWCDGRLATPLIHKYMNTNIQFETRVRYFFLYVCCVVLPLFYHGICLSANLFLFAISYKWFLLSSWNIKKVMLM